MVKTAEALIHGIGVPPNDTVPTPSAPDCKTFAPERKEGAVVDLLMSVNSGLSGLRGKR